MIYLKNNAETQEVFIPKQNVVTNLKPSYKDGYRDGLQDGKQQQKDQLLNLYITENGQYEREDGWGVVTVDIDSPDCNNAYDEGYNQGYEDGQNSVECPEGDDNYNRVFANTFELQQYMEAQGITELNGICVFGAVGAIQNISDGKATYWLDGAMVVDGSRFDFDPNFDEIKLKEGAQIALKGDVVYNADAEYVLTINNSFLINYELGQGKRYTATSNGQVFIEADYDSGYTTLQTVLLDVEVEGGANLSEFYETIKENGTYEYLPSDGGLDGFSKVTINANIPTPKASVKTEEEVKSIIDTEGKVENVYIQGAVTEIEQYRNGRLTFWIGGLRIGNAKDVGGINFTDENKIKVGDNIIIFSTSGMYAITRERYEFSNCELIAICANENGGSCNLEDKWVTPSMTDRDDNGYVVTYPSEGFDGLSRVVIDPTTIYNEGVEEGKNQGGGSGDCNIQIQKRVELNGSWEVFHPDEGYDGVYEIIVDAYRKAEEWREDGKNNIRNKLQSIEITENGRYSVEDLAEKVFIVFDGNSYFDTGIVPTEQTKIEVMFRCQGEIWYEDMYILGCSQLNLHIGGTALNGKWAEGQTGNIPYYENVWTSATFDRDNLCTNNGCADWNEGDKDSGWEGYNETIKIGKLGDEQLFKQQIAYVKIWVNKDDDSTMTLFQPNNMAQGGFGLVNSDGIEYSNISNLGEGTTTFMSELGPKYSEGWKEINVNVTPSAIEGMKFGNSTFEECPFNLELIEDFTYLFEDCKKLKTSPSIKKPIKNARYMFNNCESLLVAQTYDTSEATDLGGMYAGCYNLRTVGTVDCSSLPNSPIGWDREAEIFDTNQYKTLSDFGGFINLKQTVDLSGLIALADYSVESIFNNLYDFSGNGQTPNSIQGKIYMSSFITDIVEQYRTIAENKGWTVIIN
ncbi:MAG: hypothetical protein UD103_06970 [Bacteroidales bacterium]|nr:hypothetical protein [Bacteroidales bacterium]